MTIMQLGERSAALLFGVCFAFYAAAKSNGKAESPHNAQKSIVILYENDVHCAIDGYARLAGLRDAIAASDTAWVAVTSSGDFLNGALPGAISSGQYIVDIMRQVGYDAVTVGNHEFDFGMTRMTALLPQIGAPVTCTNLFREDDQRPLYPGGVIKSYGEKRVGYVGVCTPASMVDEAYAFFDENGRKCHDLRPDDIVTLVQHAVDSVRLAGANYVVVLSHLGEMNFDGFIDSHTLISKLSGVDAMLDGHTHSVVPCDRVQDRNQHPVPVTQTGTQFAYIGKLVISADGRISTSLIPVKDIPYSSPQVTATTDSIKRLMSAITDEVIGYNDFMLTAADSRGDWLVRKGETNLGDLCADAFRERCSADIGLVNGGGIRNNIAVGTITFGDAVNALPYCDLMCKIEVSGEMLLNMLKKCTERYPQTDGSFPQVSGLKFTLHTSSHAVTDVQVMNRATAQYEPLRPDGNYTVAVSDYYKSGFCGALKKAASIEQTTEVTYTVLSQYIKNTLKGDVSAYRTPQGRIIIEE